MRFTKKAVYISILTTLILGLLITVGIGVAVLKLWPVALTWVQSAIGGNDHPAARRVASRIGAEFGNDRILQLDRTREGLAELAALAGNPELAEILRWTNAIPALGPLLKNGGYQKALEEAVRQNVPDIAQIRLDQVASPEVRAMLAEVQQVLAKSPQGAEEASTVNPNVLNLLKTEAFARLCRNSDFSRLLSVPRRSGGPNPGKETE